jgi:hypothetical protein
VNIRWLTAGLVVATLLLNGCGLFGKKEEELEPMKLVAIDESIKIKRIWTAKLGGKSDYLRVALRPVGDGNRSRGRCRTCFAFADSYEFCKCCTHF